MLEQVVALLKEDAFESVLHVCGFLNGTRRSGTKESWMLAGDALFGLCEYRRAIAHFEKAIVTRAAVATSSKAVKELDTTKAALLYKVAKCYDKLGSPKKAIEKLQAVEIKPLRVLLLLARLQKKSSSVIVAMKTYQYALDKNPLALEAACALAEHNRSVLSTSRRTVSNPKHAELAEKFPWRETYLTFLNGLTKRDYGLVCAALDQLTSDFPMNAQLLVQAGEARYDMGDEALARKCFQKACEADPYLVRGMDTYARLLVDPSTSHLTDRQTNEKYDPYPLLNLFARTALQTAVTHPEALNVMALVHILHGTKQMSGESDASAGAGDWKKADWYLQRSWSMEHRVRTLEIQALLRERQGELFHATTSIRKAIQAASHRACPGLYEKMVQIAIANEELSTAKRWATKLLEVFPATCVAHVTMARALLAEDNLREATTQVTTALQLRPSDSSAFVLRAQILSKGNMLDEAIDSLKSFILRHGATAAVALELGKCYLAKPDPPEATRYLMRAQHLTGGDASHPLTAEIEAANQSLQEIGTE